MKHYRRRFSGRVVRAVDGVSLSVKEGAAFGLLGPNGAGKTTFLKVLLAAVRASSGQALLFGAPAWDASSRREIGYLPENHGFPTYNSGRQMLDFYAALSGMASAERKKRSEELLERVGLAARADDRIGKYSKGMLQRLGLAQALMHRPKLLFLDEPGDGVDPIGRRMIRDVLADLRRKGTTIFLNSHLLSEVELFCDEVAILRRGQVALQGRLEELTTSGGYRVVAADVPGETAEAIARGAATTARNNGCLELSFSDRTTANEAIDRLREAGSAIEEVTARRSTLEDVFLEAMKEAGQ